MNFLRDRGAIALIALMFLFGCTAAESKETVETVAVPRFHTLYDSNDFDTIYNEADDDFRASSPKMDYDKFISAVRRKLGRVKSTERQQWNVFAGSGGMRITVTYKTVFENGEGTETFIFRKRKGKEPALFNYQVNSNALIVN
ncbi:MAG: DUF4019 domain-containing protein [Thermoanaerobaculia bacterium]